MISAINMKEVRRKVSSVHFADGLWDILLGAFVMMRVIWAVMPESIMPALYMNEVLITVMGFALAVCCIFGFIFVLRLKGWITNPRIGYVRTSAKTKGLMVILLCICLCSFLLPPFLITYSRPAFEMYSHMHELPAYLAHLFLLVMPIVCIFVARFFAVRRWYLYALWIIGCWLGMLLINNIASARDYGRWMTYYMYYQPLVTGGVILLAGIVIFARFLRNNPKVVTEELNEQTQSG